MSSRSSGREPGPDPDLEDIAWLAAEIGAAPIAVVGLIEGQAATFRPAAGVGAGRAMGASAAGLALAVARHGATLVVPDLDSDARFAKDPVTDPPLQARAFAGVPMQAAGDAALGVVLLFDLEPRPFLPWQVRAIERLAGLASRWRGTAGRATGAANTPWTRSREASPWRSRRCSRSAARPAAERGRGCRGPRPWRAISWRSWGTAAFARPLSI
jgi:hypothetical protein